MSLYPDELSAHTFPTNTPERRWGACGCPDEMRAWSFDTLPEHDGNREAASWVRAWAALDRPEPPGVVLWGPAGTGKTSLMVSALRARAERGDGSLGLWNIITRLPRPSVRPAPVWYESWNELRERLRLARRGRAVDEDGDAITEAEMLHAFDDRTAVLGVDDVDLDPISPWKEGVMLRLLARIERLRPLVLTSNTGPEEFAARFGERVADRLHDRRRFALLHVGGHSLRRMGQT